jgi:flavorubredoxin
VCCLRDQDAGRKENAVKAIVVYESHWGNTAAIARAIAEGICQSTGAQAQALSTAEATGAAIAGADLIVAGAPLLGFSLPTDGMIEGIRKNPGQPADLSHPTMRAWLTALPKGHGRAAAFETRIWWSPGSAAKTILRMLEAAGCNALAPAGRFIVKGKFGPLKDGEIERARQWGAQLALQLAQAMK